MIIEAQIARFIGQKIGATVEVGGLNNHVREGISCSLIEQVDGKGQLSQPRIAFVVLKPDYVKARIAADDIRIAMLDSAGTDGSTFGSFGEVMSVYYGQTGNGFHVFSVSSYFAY